MRVGVTRETAPGERRVALVPETAGKLAKAGFEVVVEAGAGDAASFPDAAYTDAGVTIGDAWAADAVLKVSKPNEAETARLRDGQLLISYLDPLADPAGIEALASRGVVAFAMESIPRTTRAQSMDALSSQATVGGYKAALLAAENLPRFFPMLMTAAGTVPPAKVLVIGAGVAGLQAIATARRLGAIVTATDVRPAAKEQVQSLGAKFIAVMCIDDWYMGTPAPDQLRAAAFFRAVECGLPLVRSATLGSTLAIDAHGNLLGELPLNKPSALQRTLDLPRDSTVFPLIPVFPIAAAVFAFVLPWLPGRRKTVPEPESTSA